MDLRNYQVDSHHDSTRLNVTVGHLSTNASVWLSMYAGSLMLISQCPRHTNVSFFRTTPSPRS